MFMLKWLHLIRNLSSLFNCFSLVLFNMDITVGIRIVTYINAQGPDALFSVCRETLIYNTDPQVSIILLF